MSRVDVARRTTQDMSSVPVLATHYIRTKLITYEWADWVFAARATERGEDTPHSVCDAMPGRAIEVKSAMVVNFAWRRTNISTRILILAEEFRTFATIDTCVHLVSRQRTRPATAALIGLRAARYYAPSSTSSAQTRRARSWYRVKISA